MHIFFLIIKCGVFNMKIAVFGAGYVGLVTGTCFAELGNDVTLVDIDKKRVDNLNKGIIPIYEPGLDELIIRNVKENRLFFTLDYANAIKDNEIIFVAVGTPPKENGETDLSYVLDVAKKIGQNINGYKVIVNKSTVPVCTADKVKDQIKANMKDKHSFDVVSNPEFLKEGSAIQDFMVPDRIVVGVDSDKARAVMEELYESIARTNKPLMITDVKSSELIKYASNAMLATRISFMNQISHLCEEVGADIKEVAKGMGTDTRIGPRFLQAGVGYGGSCFPKDVQSLAHTLKEYGLNSELIDAVENVNNKQKKSLLKKIKTLLGNDLKQKTITIWGLAFKPKTDDMREAPSLVIIDQLLKEGAKIKVFDPISEENAKKMLDKTVTFYPGMYDCLEKSDCLILLTEWDEFRSPDWGKIKQAMNKHNIIDGRNIYDPKKMREKGFTYLSIGRR